jgi:hypothetical protein
MKTIITGSMLAIIALSASGTVFADYTKNCDGCRMIEKTSIINGITFRKNILHCDQCNAATPTELDISTSACAGQEITNCGGRLQCGSCATKFTYPANYSGSYTKYCHNCQYNRNYMQLSCSCGDQDVKGNVGPSYQIFAVLDDPDNNCEKNKIEFYPDLRTLGCPKGSNPH